MRCTRGSRRPPMRPAAGRGRPCPTARPLNPHAGSCSAATWALLPSGRASAEGGPEGRPSGARPRSTMVLRVPKQRAGCHKRTGGRTSRTRPLGPTRAGRLSSTSSTRVSRPRTPSSRASTQSSATSSNEQWFVDLNDALRTIETYRPELTAATGTQLARGSAELSL